MNHKRVRGKSLEQRIWRLMRVNPEHPWSPKTVAEWLQINEHSASAALRRLLKKGCATATGTTNDRRYAPTAVTPDDFRGMAAGTTQNLLHYGQAQVRTTLRHPPKRRRSPLLLEQLWR